MEFLHRKRFKIVWKLKYKKVVLTIIKIIVFFIGWAVLAGIIDVPSDEPVVWRFFAELIPLIVMILFTVVFYFIEKKEIKIPISRHVGRGLSKFVFDGSVWQCVVIRWRL